MTRKEFLAGTAAFAASFGRPAFAKSPDEIRAVLLHMGMNMWGEWRAEGEPKIEGKRYTQNEIHFSEDIWNRTIDHAKQAGLNMVVMDLGEFLKYPSHPELAVKGSWSAERMQAEVKRLKQMGLEPIPKMNFSATHHQWLKKYSRMLCTRAYYRVCSDIIRDVAEIFGRPRFMHLGFDEEKVENQRKRLVVCVRQNEMWWHDLLWFVKHVEKQGSRAWIFSDYGWHHPEFIEKCPKSVLQSNWYYNEDAQGYDIDKMTDWFKPKLRLFADLDKAGFEQVPCPSNWLSPKLKESGRKDNSDCAREVVKYCRANIAPERLKGFMMASWTDCKGEGAFKFNCAGIDQLAAAL
jgi:hypothetical protein